MRKLFFALVVAAAAILPWQAASAAPGQVTKADPQLLQTWWTSLAVRDGVRERDTVRIEHNGQTVGEALVVSVTADHSVVMLKGSHPGTPQVGDNVVFVKQAAVVPETVAHADTSKLGYKVVGGHSMLSFDSFSTTNNSIGQDPMSISTEGFTPVSLQSDTLPIDGGLGLSSGLNFTGTLNFSTAGFSSSWQVTSDVGHPPDFGF